MNDAVDENNTHTACHRRRHSHSHSWYELVGPFCHAWDVL